MLLRSPFLKGLREGTQRAMITESWKLSACSSIPLTRSHLCLDRGRGERTPLRARPSPSHQPCTLFGSFRFSLNTCQLTQNRLSCVQSLLTQKPAPHSNPQPKAHSMGQGSRGIHGCRWSRRGERRASMDTKTMRTPPQPRACALPCRTPSPPYPNQMRGRLIVYDRRRTHKSTGLASSPVPFFPD